MKFLRVVSLCLAAAGVAFGFSACRPGNEGSGAGMMMEKTYEVENFDVLQFTTFMYVTLQHGDKQSVKIKADSTVLAMMDVSSRHGCLWIGVDDRENYAKLSNRNRKIEVEVTYTDLKELMCTGAVKVTMKDTLHAEKLNLLLRGASVLNGAVDVASKLRVSVVGASSLELSYLRADNVDMEVTGASSVELNGDAASAKLAFTGSSVFKGANWKVDSLYISAFGASNAEVNAVGNLRAEAMGASTIYYVGMPDTLEESSTGASNILSM